MGEVGEGFAALSEAVVFLNHFKNLPEPRQLRVFRPRIRPLSAPGSGRALSLP
jgi:hypothetical protein